jgi:hypothetical protein
METNNPSSTTSPKAWLKRLNLGEPQELAPYTIYPLCVGEAGPEPDLLLTHQAIGAQVLEILEKGEAEVQELEALNKGKKPVLILEGDTLVGCKQNRVVARSVILGGKGKVAIPVGCMEQGRWDRASGSFGSGKMRISPSVRSASIREVREAKKARQPRTSVDQSRLWGDVQLCIDHCEVDTPTSDYHAVIEEQSVAATERARTLEALPGQVGGLVMAGGAFLGLELAGHPDTWNELAERTLPAILMDGAWLSEDADEAASPGPDASAWLSRIQNAPVTLSPGLAQGIEVDVEDEDLAGSGLWFEEQLVHLAIFAS